MLFTIVALGLAIGAIPMRGQTISFFSHFSASGMDNATAVAADSSGIYVFGNGPDRGAWMRKFDSMGNVLWTREFSSPAVQVFRAQAADTGVYVLGFGGPTTDFVLRKYSAAGDELWTAPVEVSAGALAADATGVYVAGGNYQSALLRKYSPDGTALWTRQFGAIQTATGVAVDATGVYVQVTYSNGAAGVVVRKYDSGGSELWTAS